MLTHRGCGGEVQEDNSIHYDVDEEDGQGTIRYPAYRCTKCREEILGDAQIEWDLTK